MKNSNSGSKLVYSTFQGSICPGCSQAKASCICRKLKKTELPETDGLARLRYETSGHKGKGVTLISGLALNTQELLELAKRLKQRFGTGGAVKDYTIQLQGDFCQPAAQELRRLGYSVK